MAENLSWDREGRGSGERSGGRAVGEEATVGYRFGDGDNQEGTEEAVGEVGRGW